MKRFGSALAVIIALLTVSSVLPCALAQSQVSKKRRTDSFNAEDDLNHQVRIPQYVVDQILTPDRGEKVDGEIERGNESLGRLQGVLINLESNGKPGLLVMGPLGANVTTFSIFRNIRGKYRMLMSGPSLSLSLNNSYTNGLRDIELASVTADTVFESTVKFDGKEYRAVKCWWRTIGTKRNHYIKCNRTD